MAAPPRKRPVGVVIRAVPVIAVGTVLTFVATIAVLASFVLLALNAANAVTILLLSILVLAFSIIVLVAGIGLYNLRPWAWGLAVIAIALQLVSVLAHTGIRWSPELWENLAWLLPGFSLVYLVAIRRQFRA